MNKISDIDMEDLSYQMDFFLWFHYKDGLKNVEEIEFLNAKKRNFSLFTQIYLKEVLKKNGI
jgi:hypothetical protein